MMMMTVIASIYWALTVCRPLNQILHAPCFTLSSNILNKCHYSPYFTDKKIEVQEHKGRAHQTISPGPSAMQVVYSWNQRMTTQDHARKLMFIGSEAWCSQMVFFQKSARKIVPQILFLDSGRLRSVLKSQVDVQDLVSTHSIKTHFGENSAAVQEWPLELKGFHFPSVLSHRVVQSQLSGPDCWT